MTEDHVSGIIREWQRERPDLDVSPVGVIGRLHRLSLALTEQLVAVYREHGLTEGEFDVLATLRRVGEPYERTPGDLATHTMVTTGAMTKRIDRLEDAGLVTRRVSRLDGRGRVIALTTEGRERIDRAFEAHIANEQRLVAALDPDDRRAIEPILARWLAKL
jgi:DNA-binding MarR family transcriptional regulator